MARDLSSGVNGALFCCSEEKSGIQQMQPSKADAMESNAMVPTGLKRIREKGGGGGREVDHDGKR